MARNLSRSPGLAWLTLAAALLPAAIVHGAPWSRTFGGAGAGEGVHAVGETPAGEIVVAATTDSFGTATGDAWLIRLGADGNVLSQAVVGNAAPGGVDGAVVLADGGAVFASRNVREFFLQHDATITRVAADGSPTWTTDITSDPGRYFVNDVIAASDGTFVGVGHASPSDAGPSVLWLIRLRANGTVLWQQYHGGVAGSNSGIDAGVETADGGFALTGWAGGGFPNGPSLMVAKATSAGALTWIKGYRVGFNDTGAAIVELPGGGYAVVATTDVTASGRAGWIVRLDAAGDVLWHDVLGDAEWSDLQAITLAPDGNLLVLGRISEPGFATNDLWALKVDAATGAILWQRAYAGDSGDYANELMALAGGDLLLAGAWGWGFPEEDLWLLRTDADGLIPACGLVRDTAVRASSPTVTDGTGFLPPYPPIGASSTGSVVTGTSVLVATTQCDGAACPALRCGAVTSAPDPACGAGAVTLTAGFSGGTPPFVVTWDLDGDTLVDATGNPVVVPLAVGSHDVSATVVDSCPGGALSCTMPATIVVHPDLTPMVTPGGPTSFCAARGESVTLDAGAGHASYQWSRDGSDLLGETGQSLLVTTSGAYAVRIVDANGCTWTSAPVLVDAGACAPCPALSCGAISVDPTPSCEGTQQQLSVTVAGGIPPVTVTWDLDGDTVADLAGNPVLASLGAGSHVVAATAVDSCSTGVQSCTTSTTLVVHPDLTPVVIPDGPTSFCAAAGESVGLDAGAGHATYQWTLDGSDIAGETGRTLVAALSGAYAVRVVDVNGCEWTSAPLIVDAAVCPPCLPLTCDAILVDPLVACEGTQQALELVFGGGVGPVAVTWDLDGDTVPESPGNPVLASLPAGTTRVTAFATDACPTGPSRCEISQDVDVLSATPPGEVSDVRAGGIPLLVHDHGARLTFEERADAAAYSLYAGAIGTWYAPDAASGSACFVVTASSGPGRLETAPGLAVNTWVVVTGSTACAEGPAGRNSFGVDRMTRGTWPLCGPSP